MARQLVFWFHVIKGFIFNEATVLFIFENITASYFLSTLKPT